MSRFDGPRPVCRREAETILDRADQAVGVKLEVAPRLDLDRVEIIEILDAVG